MAARLSIIAVLALAVAALVGWQFGYFGLTWLLPGTTPISPVGSLGLIVSAAACLLVAGPRGEARTTIACILATVVLVFGIGVVCQSIFQFDFHLDQLLFSKALERLGLPGDFGPAPNSGLNFILFGAAFLLFATGKEKPGRFAHIFILATSVLALLALLGYAYSEPRLYQLSNFVAMSFPAAMGFMLLSAAMFALERRVGIMAGVALLLTVVAANGLVSVLGTQRLISSNAWVEHTRRVSLEVDGVINSLLNIEAGVRGYLYTNQPQYLDSYNIGKQEIDGHMAALAALTADNLQQQKRLEQLRSEVQQAQRFFDQLAALQSSGKQDAAKALVMTGTANPIMDQARSTAADMKQEELQLVGSRSEEAERSSHYVLVMAAVTHAVVAILLIFAALLVKQDLAKRTTVARQFQELSDREHQARQMAEAAHQRAEGVLSSIAEMFTLIDKDWNIAYVNEQVTRVTGKPRIALLGKDYWSVFPENVGTEIETAFRRAAEAQRPETFEAFDAALRKWFSVQLYPANGGLTVFAQDVTELKQAQEGLVRAEKLAAVGRMASSIAHEINNPLEAVTNLIWLARNDPSVSSSVLKHLAAADEELRRVAQISKQALGFYRDSNTASSVDVREVIESVLSLYARRLAGKHISVRTEYDGSVVYGYAGELRQLFSNLCANALDALQPGGNLAVRVSAAHDWADADCGGIRVTFADDGIGIRREHVSHLFQPFFTTKEATGTGLGLWVSKQIAEKHGGWIRLRSSSDPQKHYTAVTVFLRTRDEVRHPTVSIATEETAEFRRAAS